MELRVKGWEGAGVGEGSLPQVGTAPGSPLAQALQKSSTQVTRSSEAGSCLCRQRAGRVSLDVGWQHRPAESLSGSSVAS